MVPEAGRDHEVALHGPLAERQARRLIAAVLLGLARDARHDPLAQLVQRDAAVAVDVALARADRLDEELGEQASSAARRRAGDLRAARGSEERDAGGGGRVLHADERASARRQDGAAARAREPMIRMRRLLEARMGKQGKREFVQVLRLMEVFRVDDVAAGVRDAIDRGVIGFDAVKHLVLCRIERRPPRLDMTVYPYLPHASVALTSARTYLDLLTGVTS